MAEVLSKGTLFSQELVTDLFSKVKGKSSMAALSGQEPIPFNGNEVMTFSMDAEVDLVAENGKRTAGGISVDPVKVTPLLVEYGARVSNEFRYASEEKQLEILKAFNDGFARKVARGLDIMVFHGVNPRTGAESSLIGTNSFDTSGVRKIDYDKTAPDGCVEDAISLMDTNENDVSGMAISKDMRSALAKQTDKAGAKLYPQLAWGSNPGTINGCRVEVNSTVSFGSSKDKAIMGDFQNAFKWGYAKQVTLEVIPYGDPDNSGKDLQGYGQVYLRAQTYIGWGILDKDAFVMIVEPDAA
jgi:HK97 family phage major capsid protein